MSPIKKIFILFACFAFGFPQSMINSYGMGNPSLYRDVASAGLTSSGLVPGYGKDFSLMNPSTWTSSKYSLFSSTFQGATRLFNREDIQNQYSNFDWMIFIIPIKQKYAFGIGLFPYTDLNAHFTRTELLTPESDESSTIHQIADYTGGISSLRFAFGFPLGNFGLGGWEIDLLFGSTRVKKSTEINDEIYIHNKRKMFNGSKSQVYLTSNPLIMDSKEIIFYLNLGFTFREFSAEVQSFQPFIDLNHNGVHDLAPYDFPGIDKSPYPEQTYFNDFYKPIELNIGANVKYTSEISMIYEGGLWRNNSKIPDELFEFKDELTKKIYFTHGLVKYADEFPQNIFNKFHWRTGFSISQMSFQYNPGNVDKFDLSVGWGLPFGKFGNQLGFAYTYSKIKGGILINETVKTIKIGLTIGDIWFVKRRNR